MGEPGLRLKAQSSAWLSPTWPWIVSDGGRAWVKNSWRRLRRLLKNGATITCGCWWRRITHAHRGCTKAGVSGAGARRGTSHAEGNPRPHAGATGGQPVHEEELETPHWVPGKLSRPLVINTNTNGGPCDFSVRALCRAVPPLRN